MVFVKREWFDSVMLFISIYEIMLYVGGVKNGGQVVIFYHIHLIENMGFLEDLFCLSKAFRALKNHLELFRKILAPHEMRRLLLR